jgi:hypothetical protein
MKLLADSYRLATPGMLGVAAATWLGMSEAATCLSRLSKSFSRRLTMFCSSSTWRARGGEWQAGVTGRARQRTKHYSYSSCTGVSSADRVAGRPHLRARLVALRAHVLQARDELVLHAVEALVQVALLVRQPPDVVLAGGGERWRVSHPQALMPGA